MSSIALPSSRIQYAALPWRRVDNAIQILLITTLNTRRWIVPKGWPLEGHSPRECAAQEALEEAGILGEVAVKPIGWFHYDKLRKSGEVVPCRVQVFPMEVLRQRRTWAEKAARQTRWCSAEEALSHVGELGLRHLIRKFAREADRPRSRSAISSQPVGRATPRL